MSSKFIYASLKFEKVRIYKKRLGFFYEQWQRTSGILCTYAGFYFNRLQPCKITHGTMASLPSPPLSPAGPTVNLRDPQISPASPLQRIKHGEISVKARYGPALHCGMAPSPWQSKMPHGTFTALAHKYELHQLYLDKVWRRASEHSRLAAIRMASIYQEERRSSVLSDKRAKNHTVQLERRALTRRQLNVELERQTSRSTPRSSTAGSTGWDQRLLSYAIDKTRKRVEFILDRKNRLLKDGTGERIHIDRSYSCSVVLRHPRREKGSRVPRGRQGGSVTVQHKSHCSLACATVEYSCRLRHSKLIKKKKTAARFVHGIVVYCFIKGEDHLSWVSPGLSSCVASTATSANGGVASRTPRIRGRARRD